MKIKTIISAFTAAAIALSMCACSNNEQTTETGAKSVTLTESYTFDIGFYPIVTAESSQNHGITYWTHNFYQTLVKYEDGEITGDLAESWDISGNGLTYTFKLKKGLKFSDGTALNAEAVKTSIEAAIVNLGNYNGSYGRASALIDSIEAVDEQTVKINITQPYYAFLNDLTMCSALGIVNSKAFNDDLTYKTEDVKMQTFGSGAYMYNGDFAENTYTFVSNPNYSGAKPEVESFKIKAIADNDAKVLALRNGEVDIIIGNTRLGMDAYAELSKDSAYKAAISEKAALTRLLAFNLSDSVFTDDSVRQAVAYAIDKNTICTNVMQGVDTPADAYFEKNKPYCDVAVTSYDYDAQKAKSILENAGWIDSDGDGVREKDGKTLDIVIKYSTVYGSIADYVLAVSSQLEAIGFKVTSADEDMMTYYNSMLTYDFDLMISQTYGGAYDPSTVTTNMNPEVSTDPISVLYSNYFDGGAGLIAELDRTSDFNRVNEIYRSILTTIADKSLCVPVSYQHEIAAWNSQKIESYTFDDDMLYIKVEEIDLK